jgi:predicted phosphodiesterase
MRALILSDLHLDFHEDKGIGFIAGLDKTVDILILAGDISSSKLLESSIDKICNLFCNSQILYVAGNHEPYGDSMESIITGNDTRSGRLYQLEEQYDNLYWLDHHSFTGFDCYIGQQRFIGTPLWFRDDPMNPAFEYMLNDFNQIEDYRDHVYRENERAVRYLTKNVTEDDIVITHHIPTRRSVAPRYLQSPTTRFFLCDMDPMIYTGRPKMWIHGHTHVAYDYKHVSTRVICNPLGYPHEPNKFDENKIIEI